MREALITMSREAAGAAPGIARCCGAAIVMVSSSKSSSNEKRNLSWQPLLKSER